MGTSVRMAGGESSRPELWLVCSQELAALVEHGLLDHLVRRQQQRLGDRQSYRLRSLEVDDQVELRRLLDRKVAGARSPKNSINEPRRLTGERRWITGIRDQGDARFKHCAGVRNRRQPPSLRKFPDSRGFLNMNRTPRDVE